MNLRATCILVLVALLSTVTVVAQPASVTDASFQIATQPLRSLATEDAWLGYRVPIVEGAGTVCCFDRDLQAGCALTSDRASYHSHSRKIMPDTPPGRDLLVFIEPATADDRRRVQAYDSACPIDADGLRIQWLGDLPVSESLALLGPWAMENDKDRSALSAIAHHAGAEATTFLATLARDVAQPDKLRSSSAFWLGAKRADAGYRAVRDLFTATDRPSLRADLIIALAQSAVPEALDQLITIARNDRSPKVRGAALFWLAQRASARVSRVLVEAAERDPDTAVKKKAVFALSQLPPERGVPLLIDLAERHASAAVRERAIFWLGQTGDPRALTFIVSLLER